jgi:hypothetical protein
VNDVEKMMTEAQVAAANARVPDLMGMTEVADRLGVNAKNLGKVKGLPAHAKQPKAGRLWRADVIENFARTRNGSE